MAQEANVPAGFWPKVQKMVEDAVSSFARSGFLRNASITDGGLTIKGGFLRLLSAAAGGVELVYLGPIGDVLANGERQQYLMIRRADGTPVLRLWDAFPGANGTLNQALSWIDRSGNVIFADDTDSGQGLARPYLPVPFYRARNTDWVGTSQPAFETIFRAKLPKQQPQLYIRCWGVNNTAGATGEVRVMVNGVQLGATASTVYGTVNELTFGPAPVAGGHISTTLIVEIQARVASGSGLVQVEPSWGQGQQT